MEIISTLPMTPPTIAPPFELLACWDEVRTGNPVGNALAPDVYTPDGPKIAPGPYSGVSNMEHESEK